MCIYKTNIKYKTECKCEKQFNNTNFKKIFKIHTKIFFKRIVILLSSLI
jgi:hypothetical protein